MQREEDEASRLLAGPAQTTELEELLGIGGGDNIIPAVRDALQRWYRIEAQRDAAESSAEEACGELADRQQFLTDVVAERDALSLLLRGMARKLVAARRHGATLYREIQDGKSVIDRLIAERDEAQQSAKFWQGQAEYWEREHQETVLPYTTKLESELYLALWLYAEAKWWADQYKHDVVLWKRQVDDLTAERDERQARLDEIADVLGRAPGDATSAEIVEIVRTAVAVKGRRRDEAMELRARIDAVLAHLETRTRALASDLVYANERDTIRFVRAALEEPKAEDSKPKHKTEGGMCCNGKRGCGGPGSYCCSQTVYLHRHADGSRGPCGVLGALSGAALVGGQPNATSEVSGD
jgi:hypothetical protein